MSMSAPAAATEVTTNLMAVALDTNEKPSASVIASLVARVCHVPSTSISTLIDPESKVEPYISTRCVLPGDSGKKASEVPVCAVVGKVPLSVTFIIRILFWRV